MDRGLRRRNLLKVMGGLGMVSSLAGCASNELRNVELENVEVVGSDLYGYAIEGVVRNTGSEAVGSLWVFGEFFVDDVSVHYDTSRTFELIKAGESKEFRVNFAPSPAVSWEDVTDYELKVEKAI